MFYHTPSQHPNGYPMRAAVLRTARKEAHCVIHISFGLRWYVLWSQRNTAQIASLIPGDRPFTWPFQDVIWPNNTILMPTQLGTAFLTHTENRLTVVRDLVSTICKSIVT
jgi:hypothetical protein